MRGLGSAKDPFALTGLISYRGYNVPQGRTLRDPRLVAGERTFIGLVAGQSLGANWNTLDYTPVSPRVENLNVFDGGVYAAQDPMLGCDGTGGTWLNRCADKMIAAGMFDRVIWAPVGLGGSPLINGWEPTKSLYPLIPTVFRRLAALGLSTSAILWQQGEADVTLGTSQADYTNALNALIAATRSDGFLGPWFIAHSTLSNNTVISPTIRAAQAAVVNGVDVFAGADTDTLTGPTYRFDTQHLNAAGSDANATLWKSALDAVF